MFGEVTPEVLIEGYQLAYGRFDKRRVAPPESTFKPLFEALNWAVAIDDRLQRDLRGSQSRAEWYASFDRTEDRGEVLLGIRFARNRVHHQWAAAIGERPATEPERAGRTRVPYAHYGRWYWRLALPKGNPDPSAETAYRQLLAGQPVSKTLKHLSIMFDGIKPRLRPKQSLAHLRAAAQPSRPPYTG